ncbi:hypothetical protein CJ030_MR5G025004 [Morella rubra]|uniref:Uncharacterized protein n=1 Tax=Morella rubra TaxID=262757 RepID=A0A6A1VK77_9ROSI|nr:hypothetical protein CJ030_MR5G025004 [Morella rubra]
MESVGSTEQKQTNGSCHTSFDIENPRTSLSYIKLGVKFKVGSSKNLFDIQFNNDILEIPRFIVGPLSELPIRNIVVFEQYSDSGHYMNDYVMLLRRLVNSPKDVDLLVKNGIIEKRSDFIDGTNHIHNLSRYARSNLNNFYFANLCEDLNVYYRSSWHQWKANLKQNYFNTPWAIISFVAAVVLLLLTLIQTASSVISIA